MAAPHASHEDFSAEAGAVHAPKKRDARPARRPNGRDRALRQGAAAEVLTAAPGHGQGHGQGHGADLRKRRAGPRHGIARAIRARHAAAPHRQGA